jgi:hypothetical protein
LGQNDFTNEKVSSDYDITTFVFDYRESYETISIVFHFVITQHIKFRRVYVLTSADNKPTTSWQVNLVRDYDSEDRNDNNG